MEDFIKLWDQKMAELCASGKTRQEAVSWIARNDRRLHTGYVYATNVAAGRHNAVAHLEKELGING